MGGAAASMHDLWSTKGWPTSAAIRLGFGMRECLHGATRAVSADTQIPAVGVVGCMFVFVVWIYFSLFFRSDSFGLLGQGLRIRGPPGCPEGLSLMCPTRGRGSVTAVRLVSRPVQVPTRPGSGWRRSW